MLPKLLPSFALGALDLFSCVLSRFIMLGVLVSPSGSLIILICLYADSRLFSVALLFLFV